MSDQPARRRVSPRPDQKRHHVGVKLDPEQVPALDAIAAARGTYRAHLIREAVADYLARSA